MYQKQSDIIRIMYIGGINIRIVGSKNLANLLLTNIIKVTIANNYAKDLKSMVFQIQELADIYSIEAIGCGIPVTLSDDKRTIFMKYD